MVTLNVCHIDPRYMFYFKMIAVSPLTTICTAANISSMLVPIFMAISGTTS